MNIRGSKGAFALAGAAALLASVGACSTDSTNTGSSSTLSSAAAPTTTASRTTAAGPSVTEQQGQQLCTDLGAQLSNWRVQGPTLGRGGLNIVVQTWAAQSGVNNLAVVQDRTIVDDVTIEYCPDVRSDAISALDIPDLASGLVGF